MKKFNQAKMVLFDSTIASFKLSVEASFTRSRQDGSVGNLVYVTEKGTANLNPSIYLVFAFKGETYESTKNLYTSFPQLFRIRSVMEHFKDLLIDNKGFVEVESTLTVRPEHQQPVTIADIGRKSKWISFTLVAVDPSEEGMTKKVPGVSIQISDSEYVSVLTGDEFLTVYTIIKDIDLASISAQLSSLFLIAEDGQGQPQYGQPMYQQQPYQPQQQQYQPQYQQQPAPQPQQYQQRQATPRYGNQPMQRPSQQRTIPAPTSSPVNQQPAAPVQQQSNQPAGLPPRKTEKQIVNMKSVEETPVSTVNFNDEDAINSIFSDEK
jgi:hypothetical protein